MEHTARTKAQLKAVATETSEEGPGHTAKPNHPIESHMGNKIMFREKKVGKKEALFYYYHIFLFSQLKAVD